MTQAYDWHDDPAITVSDYSGGGIVNLMSSIAIALGATSAYAPAHALPGDILTGARHIVLLVIDGLGHDYLLRHDGHLRRHLCGALTSVFPSTTAAAIPAFLTGLAPQQHGLTGWHMYFREIGAIAAPLPYRLRAGGHTVRTAGVSAAELFGPAPLGERLQRPCHIVSPAHIVDSDFNVAFSGSARRHAYRSLDELVAVVAALLRDDAPQSYVHAYWPLHDSLAHQHGIDSPQVADAFAALDAAFGELVEAARNSGSVIIATADHGFIDTAANDTIDLDTFPELRETLLLPLCGEPRMAFAYVRAGRETRFEQVVQDRLAGAVHLLRSEDALRAGWFGGGHTHPLLSERIGDYLLIPRKNRILRDWLRGEARHTQIGVHGGLLAAEMTVPLVVAPGA